MIGDISIEGVCMTEHEKKVIILLGFYDDGQLKRLLRFLDNHGFLVYAVNDAESVKVLGKEGSNP